MTEFPVYCDFKNEPMLFNAFFPFSSFSGQSEGFIHDAVFGIGRNRGMKLILDGNDYYRYHMTSNVSHWLCSQYNICRCKARALTKTINGKSVAKHLSGDEHNHPTV